jgi:hypothetical protein
MLSFDPRRIYITTVLYVSSACILNLASHHNYHFCVVNFPNGLVGRKIPNDIAWNICSLTRCDREWSSRNAWLRSGKGSSRPGSQGQSSSREHFEGDSGAKGGSKEPGRRCRSLCQIM